ncbi:uncharacterized protein PV09_04380 [Verruconis gallopava]|uniref:Zn(2)-C6 fungal-type domain-containing protein n=1 Tax=Verruconis gallopava TaxID=253628 RepID=A0A0D2AZV2_9PEZI|nr:uncharacterized protein PV09_04380 [Verruconis gallopava]KIW04634.1 hypothetical protein PV09_04380 [Verruconis gallopava]
MNISFNNTIVDFGDSNNVTQQHRRNGKLQSCEPCRKSKLRCDHVIPACGRCVKRRRVEKCVYHPAPLTQTRNSSSRRLPSPASSSAVVVPNVIESVEITVHDQLQRVPSGLIQSSIHLPPRARAVSAPVALEDRRGSTAKDNPGFLGLTSYSAVFEADLENLGVSTFELRARDSVETIPLSSETILRGCKILSIFKDSLMVNRFINKFQEVSDNSGEAVIFPIVRQWLKDLWTYHRDTLRDQNPAAISRLCERIWRNTQSPLNYDGNTTAKKYASLTSGHNLRWEVVGLILTDIGLAAQSTDPLDDIFREHNTTREAISKRTYEAAQSCLSFCRDSESRDDLFLWFLNETCWLTSSVKGSSSYAAYQQTGEMINAMLAMGFQQEIKADSRTPFFIAELRKRNRISVYGQEVALASMLGRPCRLSHRYTSLELPLDLTDAEIFSEGEQLRAALAKLDSDGWRVPSEWNRTTYMRANMLHAPRREDIVDISLGNYSTEEIVVRVAQIRERYAADWARAPEMIRVARETPAGKSTSIVHALYMNVVRHGYLANELLLQQVLIRKLGTSADELIKFARLIFKDIMALSGRHEMLKEYRMDFIWLLAAHGLRSAAILAVELYKQEQLPVYPANPRLPRAETIRELSIFVDRLSAIEDSGMHSFTEQGRRVINCILDKILAPPRPPPAAMATPATADAASTTAADGPPLMQIQHGTTFGDFEGINFGELDASINFGNDADFMHWLDTMDWEKQGVPGISGSGSTGF